MTLMIADTGRRLSKIAPLFDTFLRHRVEGLIYVAEYHQRITQPPIPQDTPVVLANCFDDLSTPAILPDEISVAGYDNYRVIAETLFPPLTTVEQPYAAMGVCAAQRLLALISGESREDRSPTLVAGPVYWRNSVTELARANISQLPNLAQIKAAREV